MVSFTLFRWYKNQTIRLTESSKVALKKLDFEMSILKMARLLAIVSDRVSACFRPDGPRGTVYADYTDFHDVMEKISANSDDLLDKHLLPDERVEGFHSYFINLIFSQIK